MVYINFLGRCCILNSSSYGQVSVYEIMIDGMCVGEWMGDSSWGWGGLFIMHIIHITYICKIFMPDVR